MIGISSVQREAEEIIPMKQMKMDWIPCIPLENRCSLSVGGFELILGQASVLTFVCQCLDIIVHFELSTETAKLLDLNHKYLFWAALRGGTIALFHSSFLSVLLFIVLYVFRFCNQCYVTAV